MFDMSLGKYIICVVAILCCVGCTSERNKAEKTAKDFLETYLKDNDIAHFKSSDIDSTTFVTDSMIAVMKDVAAASDLFNGQMEYGTRAERNKLFFINARYDASDGNKRKHTFYMNRSLDAVVCLKDDTPMIVE